MATRRNAVWAELVQLVPIISLAFPFIIEGKVDMSRAGTGFLIGALLAIPISSIVVLCNQLLNPILVGAGIWLWLGALAFKRPIVSVAAWLVQTQAFGLFAAALAAGLTATFISPHGYIACRSSDPRWIRRASIGLLGFTVVILCWTWLFRRDIRLGGGLPFIVLNVARRVLGRRAPVAEDAGP